MGVNVTLGTLAMSISVKYELQMKRKEGEEVPKKRVGRKKTKQDTSEDEEDCAAFSCLRPSGKLLISCKYYKFRSGASINYVRGSKALLM